VTLDLLSPKNKFKYVNMADINANPPRSRNGKETQGVAKAPNEPAFRDAKELYMLIEALFFAYRDFTSDPDRILDEIGFGRAHHRVLHFVNRYPGMRVADLLEILQITKQSLARVLRELVHEGYIEQYPAEADRRARLLFVTPNGRALARRLATPQLARMRKALAALDAEGRAAVMQFLAEMSPESGVSGRNGRFRGRGQKTEAEQI
jgi:DNA-binding MarR family transcriptional regulator